MKNINFLKTIYYNYHFFGIQGLRHMPIIVHSRVVFKDISGKITIDGGLKKGTIRFGSAEPLATRDMQYERTIIDLSGELSCGENIHVAPGSRISINKGACLRLGNNFNSTGNCTIICDKDIRIGNNCLFSWDIQIMDADFHKILNNRNEWINPPHKVEIGNNVWLCSRTTLLKGSKIPNGCVVASGSVITKRFNEDCCVIAGVGKDCRIVRTEISWIP